MTLLVGLSPDARDDAGGAVGLAARLAAAWDEDVAVAVVVPPDDGVDHDARVAEARRAVQGVLAGAGREARWITVPARSPAEALLSAAGEQTASAVVLGTDPDRSGRVAVRVARASPVPVVLARGTGSAPDEPVTRVTCAYDGTRGSDAVLVAAADVARRSGAALRVASFAVRRPPTIPPEVGLDAEGPVVAGWVEQTAAAQHDAVERLGVEAECGVWSGPTWDAAVLAADWHPGDLLVLGPSVGAVTRFFLGDRLGALVQAAPVPALIVGGAFGS